MTITTQEERWSETRDFPRYLVSDNGRVQNKESGHLITPTTNNKGLVMVGLMHERKQYKRSLALMVADEFVPRPQQESFDTPIHLDGDRSNNCYYNLMWRPLWFARRYMRQFTDDHRPCMEPIEDVETGEIYDNSMHACMVNGLLDVDLVIAMMTNGYSWPTGQVFRKANVR